MLIKKKVDLNIESNQLFYFNNKVNYCLLKSEVFPYSNSLAVLVSTSNT